MGHDRGCTIHNDIKDLFLLALWVCKTRSCSDLQNITFVGQIWFHFKKWAINKQYWWLKKNGVQRLWRGSLLHSTWFFMCNAHCDTTCSGWMCMQWGRILHPYRRLLWFLPVPDRKWSREWADTIMRTRHSIQPRQMCVRLSWCVYLPFGMFSGYSLSGRCFMLCYR